MVSFVIRLPFFTLTNYLDIADGNESHRHLRSNETSNTVKPLSSSIFMSTDNSQFLDIDFRNSLGRR